MERYVKIRHVAVNSREITIPMEIVKLFGLEFGDTARWVVNGDTVSVQFLKQPRHEEAEVNT